MKSHINTDHCSCCNQLKVNKISNKITHCAMELLFSFLSFLSLFSTLATFSFSTFFSALSTFSFGTFFPTLATFPLPSSDNIPDQPGDCRDGHGSRCSSCCSSKTCSSQGAKPSTSHTSEDGIVEEKVTQSSSGQTPHCTSGNRSSSSSSCTSPKCSYESGEVSPVLCLGLSLLGQDEAEQESKSEG